LIFIIVGFIIINLCIFIKGGKNIEIYLWHIT
jgi:hypothetical protein